MIAASRLWTFCSPSHSPSRFVPSSPHFLPPSSNPIVPSTPCSTRSQSKGSTLTLLYSAPTASCKPTAALPMRHQARRKRQVRGLCRLHKGIPPGHHLVAIIHPLISTRQCWNCRLARCTPMRKSTPHAGKGQANSRGRINGQRVAHAPGTVSGLRPHFVVPMKAHHGSYFQM